MLVLEFHRDSIITTITQMTAARWQPLHAMTLTAMALKFLTFRDQLFQQDWRPWNPKYQVHDMLGGLSCHKIILRVCSLTPAFRTGD